MHLELRACIFLLFSFQTKQTHKIRFIFFHRQSYTIMSVRLWNFKNGGPKMQNFCPRINMLEGFFLNNPTMNDGSSKSAEI